MGNSCAKGPPRDVDEPGDPSKPGFRDRRLSVSQLPVSSSPGGRRMSVYNEDAEPPAQVANTEITLPSVSVKSVAGMEPVPGGATRKINQDRALAVYPFKGDKDVALMGCFDGAWRPSANRAAPV